MTELDDHSYLHHPAYTPAEMLAEASPAFANGIAKDYRNGSSFDGRSDDARDRELKSIIHRQLELIGEDTKREGLLKTPARVAKALTWLTRGYRQNIWDVVGGAIFNETYRGVVQMRDIEVYSLCEHHLLPFFGKAHIAYVPRGKVIGLSKLPRIVDVFARRLQVQERLTEQIADAIEEILRPEGVEVIIEAMHLCVMMRGVEKQHATTVTCVRRGIFLRNPEISIRPVRGESGNNLAETHSR